MKLYFIGADHEVTGSCHVLEAAGHKIMIDRGMEQGINIFENVDLPFAPADFDAVLLTHAHIDHSGLIPTLYAQGFQGNIYATKATCDLCDIMLRDSAHIQEFEAEWRNEKAKRQNKDPYVPLYTMEDAVGAIELLTPVDYGREIEILDGIKVRFTDVGHLLGSSCIEVWGTENGETKKIVFSGDVGNTDQPLIKDPQGITDTDYLLIESTYGDRSHGARADYVTALNEVIQRTFDRGGNVVIPSFAVGRTQEMLYFIRQIKQEGRIKNHDNFQVWVDSPLANSATLIFNKHVKDCFDKEALDLVNRGINPISFKGLQLAITSDESKNINYIAEPKVIISASGMCDAGRIKHHLKNNLWKKQNTILFVGYQAAGTVGRKLVDGADDVKLFGETVNVEAEICVLPGVSGHADREGLLAWAGCFKEPPKKTFVVHGEDSVCDSFAALLGEKLGFEAVAPFSGAIYDLINDKFIARPEGVRVEKQQIKKNQIVSGKGVSPAETFVKATASTQKKASAAYKELLDAQHKLSAVIAENDGLANKDIEKFKNELNELIGRWKR